MKIKTKLAAFKKFFDERDVGEEAEIKLTGNYVDMAQIALVSFHNKGMERAFQSLYSIETDIELPNPKIANTVRASFSYEYLKMALEAFKGEDVVFVELAENTPIKFSGKYFQITFAPRTSQSGLGDFTKEELEKFGLEEKKKE